jgi:hypothetical protein
MIKRLNDPKINDRVFMFVDLQAAYDNVLHDKLIDLLRNIAKGEREQSVATLIVDTIEKQYQGYTINAGNIIFMAQKGVVQGLVLSPLPFCKYLQALLEEDQMLRKKRLAIQGLIKTHQEDRLSRADQWTKCISLLYADDMVIEFKDLEELKTWE